MDNGNGNLPIVFTDNHTTVYPAINLPYVGLEIQLIWSFCPEPAALSLTDLTECMQHDPCDLYF